MTAPWTDLGGGVRVRQSRVYRMNSILLLDREHAVLVDPGVLPSELDGIAAVVRDAAPRAITLVFTHSHWDHVLGRPWWPRAATLGHARLSPELQRDREAILREIVEHAARAGETWSAGFEAFEPDIHAREGEAVVRGPWRLVPRDAPGHCDSQITLHLPEHRVLIAADMLSDIEIPWLDREPAAYRRTLLGLVPPVEAGDVRILVPGHGSVAAGSEAILGRLRRDLDYLEALDAEVGAARRAGLTLEETVARLAAMERGGGTPDPLMDEVHGQNVRIAWERA